MFDKLRLKDKLDSSWLVQTLEAPTGHKVDNPFAPRGTVQFCPNCGKRIEIANEVRP